MLMQGIGGHTPMHSLIAKTQDLPQALPLIESLLRVSAKVLLTADDADRTPLRVALELLLAIHRTCLKSSCLELIALLTGGKTPNLLSNTEQKKLMQTTDWSGASPLDFFKTHFRHDSQGMTWPYVVYYFSELGLFLQKLSIE